VEAILCSHRITYTQCGAQIIRYVKHPHEEPGKRDSYKLNEIASNLYTISRKKPKKYQGESKGRKQATRGLRKGRQIEGVD